MRSSFLLVMLASFSVVLPACAAPDGDSDSDADEPAFVPPLEGLAGSGGSPEPPAGTNGDDRLCLWDSGTQDAFRTLATGKLDTGSGELPLMPTIPFGCRGILRSLIKCSLSRELSITDPVTSEVYEGWWGLAPAWLKGPLDTAGRQWVTACMIQKLNYFVTEVPILMEGVHTQLTFNPILDAEYPFDESTAFGDMFSSNAPLYRDTPAFQVSVCSEEDLVTVCGREGASEWLSMRICDADNACGLTYIGKCSEVCTDVGGYWQCPDSDGNMPVETVRVQAPGFYGICP